MYHVFSHSSADGQLGCFHVLAAAKAAAASTGVHVSLQLESFSGSVPSSGIAASYRNSGFDEPPLFSIVAAQVSVPVRRRVPLLPHPQSSDSSLHMRSGATPSW